MKVLVVGATGGSGRAAVDELLRRGHEVTAFSRHAAGLRSSDGAHGFAGRLHAISGDATDPADVDRAVRGQDAVIVTLGITENALRVRLLGSRRTPLDVRSRGTRTVMDAMRRHGVPRLVVQTSYGVGATRDLLPFRQRLIFWLVLRRQIADTQIQDDDVRRSGLDWVIVQPVNLTNDAVPGPPFASTTGEVRGMNVARTSVGWFLAEAVERADYLGESVALSATARALVGSATVDD
jgi:nucleoside-diphosphate-sugar epimerase